MQENKKVEEVAVSIGGAAWREWGEVVNDTDFQSILTPQERQFIEQVVQNPRYLHNQREYGSDILAKYLAWRTYVDSDLGELRKEFNILKTKIAEAKNTLTTINETAEYIGGATVLVEYSKRFDTTAGEHGDNARTQLKYYFWSLGALAVIVWLVFFVSVSELTFFNSTVADDLNTLPLNIGFFALKAVLLIFAYQVSQFFRRNYAAEKHLQEAYLHRRDVLQSLHAVYNSLSADSEERDEILKAGALFAYERGESGYITTREGAGSADGLIEGILSKVFR